MILFGVDYKKGLSFFYISTLVEEHFFKEPFYSGPYFNELLSTNAAYIFPVNFHIVRNNRLDFDRYKETLVLQFTDGRTSSLREMMPTEYEDMCECLQSGKMMGESIADHKERLRKARSAVLKRMQRLGIDTTDSSFTPVNEFCMDLRIAGKPFGLLTVEELQSLIPKLEAILRKPKIRNTQCAVSIPLIIRSNQLPS